MSTLSLYSILAYSSKLRVSKKKKKKKASGESPRQDQVPGLHPSGYTVGTVPSLADSTHAEW